MSSGLGNGLKDRHRIQYLTEVSHQISIQEGLGSLNALVKLHVNSGCSHCSEIGKENIQDHLMLDVWPQWMVPFDFRQLQMPGVGNRQQSGKALFEVDVGHRMTDHVQASQCLKKVRKKRFFYYLYILKKSEPVHMESCTMLASIYIGWMYSKRWPHSCYYKSHKIELRIKLQNYTCICIPYENSFATCGTSHVMCEIESLCMHRTCGCLKPSFVVSKTWKRKCSFLWKRSGQDTKE